MGSYLEMKVASVKTDYTDLSCSLPIQCLQSLNADLKVGLYTSNRILAFTLIAGKAYISKSAA